MYASLCISNHCKSSQMTLAIWLIQCVQPIRILCLYKSFLWQRHINVGVLTWYKHVSIQFRHEPLGSAISICNHINAREASR